MERIETKCNEIIRTTIQEIEYKIYTKEIKKKFIGILSTQFIRFEYANNRKYSYSMCVPMMLKYAREGEAPMNGKRKTNKYNKTIRSSTQAIYIDVANL